MNPTIAESLGERASGDLDGVAAPIDVIDVFRRPEFVPGLVDGAIRSGAKLFWMQQGVRDSESARRLRDAGLEVVEDLCLMVEHMRLLGRASSAQEETGS